MYRTARSRSSALRTDDAFARRRGRAARSVRPRRPRQQPIRIGRRFAAIASRLRRARWSRRIVPRLVRSEPGDDELAKLDRKIERSSDHPARPPRADRNPRLDSRAGRGLSGGGAALGGVGRVGARRPRRVECPDPGAVLDPRVRAGTRRARPRPEARDRPEPVGRPRDVDRRGHRPPRPLDRRAHRERAALPEPRDADPLCREPGVPGPVRRRDRADPEGRRARPR